MQRMVRAGAELWFVLCLMGSFASPSIAQISETEPNDPCSRAQVIGTFDADAPFIIGGSLDTPPEVPDVDFFRFEAEPGTVWVADLKGADTGSGSLPDPFLGLFDAQCNLVAFNDDSTALNSRLQFVVPDDGVFILAASSCCDDQFTGSGGASGTYELAIAPPPPAIEAIVGQLVDAISGSPLPGNVSPFAFVELLRCAETDCTSVESVASQSTDEQGRFRFERDFFDQLLTVGRYQVQASANEFAPSTTDPFEVGEGETFDIGKIALAPPPVSFSAIQPCNNLLPQGDRCGYTVKITNNTSAPLEGLAWSIVDGFGLGSSLTYTLFEASAAPDAPQSGRQRVELKPSGEQTLQFWFDVPSFVAGATFCARVFVGLDPKPLVITVRDASLFCITGGTAGFELVSDSESQKIFRAIEGKSKALSKLPARRH